MTIEGYVFRHAGMRRKPDRCRSATSGAIFHRLNQFPSDPQALEIRVDGNVHQMGGLVFNGQDGTAGDLAAGFGDKNGVCRDVLFKTG